MNPALLDVVEELLLHPELHPYGMRLLAGLAGTEVPPWVEPVYRPFWRAVSSPARCWPSRLRAGERLAKVELAQGTLDPAMTPADRDLLDGRLPARSRPRLLTPDEVTRLRSVCPVAGAYLETCVRGHWQRGELTLAVLLLLGARTPPPGAKAHHG